MKRDTIYGVFDIETTMKEENAIVRDLYFVQDNIEEAARKYCENNDYKYIGSSMCINKIVPSCEVPYLMKIKIKPWEIVSEEFKRNSKYESFLNDKVKELCDKTFVVKCDLFRDNPYYTINGIDIPKAFAIFSKDNMKQIMGVSIVSSNFASRLIEKKEGVDASNVAFVKNRLNIFRSMLGLYFDYLENCPSFNSSSPVAVELADIIQQIRTNIADANVYAEDPTPEGYKEAKELVCTKKIQLIEKFAEMFHNEFLSVDFPSIDIYSPSLVMFTVENQYKKDYQLYYVPKANKEQGMEMVKSYVEGFETVSTKVSKIDYMTEKTIDFIVPVQLRTKNDLVFNFGTSKEGDILTSVPLNEDMQKFCGTTFYMDYIVDSKIKYYEVDGYIFPKDVLRITSKYMDNCSHIEFIREDREKDTFKNYISGLKQRHDIFDAQYTQLKNMFKLYMSKCKNTHDFNKNCCSLDYYFYLLDKFFRNQTIENREQMEKKLGFKLTDITTGYLIIRMKEFVEFIEKEQDKMSV